MLAPWYLQNMKTFYDVSEVTEAAGSQMKSILSTLFPNIKFQANQGRLGSLDGEKGASLAISLEQHKHGAYIDHSTGEKGDILDIVQHVKGVSFPEALAFLGENFTSCIQHEFNPEYVTPPTTNFKAQCTVITQEAIDYALKERKISRETLRHMKCVSAAGRPKTIGFPHFLNDNVVAIQFAELEKKDFFAASGGATGLVASSYVTQSKAQGVLTITEGPWDAASYIECGIPAVSIPNGVSNMKWLEAAWPYLAQFKRIKLSFDMDEPGQQASAKAIRRIGVNKCLVVRLPLKDA